MGSSVILPSPGQPTKGADPGFVSASQARLVNYKYTELEPPTPIAVTNDDSLVFRTFCSVAGVNVVLSVRLLVIPEGRIVLLQQTTITDGLRDKQEVNLPLTEGFLLSACVQVSGAPDVKRGQLFVNVHVNRPNTLLGQSIFPLVSDYKAAGTDTGWPGGALRQPTEGPGVARIVPIANPGAGLDWSVTVPTGARWRVQSVSMTFTASAAVASRQPTIFLDDGANVYWAHGTPAAVTAGQVDTISATGSSAPQAAPPLLQNIVIPPNLYMPAGHRLRSSTGAIQAGDTYTGINLLVEEWIEP